MKAVINGLAAMVLSALGIRCLAAAALLGACGLRADEVPAAAAEEGAIERAAAAAASAPELSADLQKLVTDTHQASLALRQQALRRTIARNEVWPEGAWGETLWALAALQLNEKTEMANARLLHRARAYLAATPAAAPAVAFSPENSDDTPWAYFSLADYVRILYLFHSKSAHFSGRLLPETEAAMKTALWLWVSRDSRVCDAGPEDLFLLLGTENHDLVKRPSHYLITALLAEDPAYRDRPLADGKTTAEHAAAYTSFFREWPLGRVRSGLWIEVGSNTYQKYSWPSLFNLHELAPDPVIRKHFGMLLDLAFIEEAQISVQGHRGGGRSRAEYERNGFESYKNLLYAPAGQPAGSSHSRVIETSTYQLPPEAILLRKQIFPLSDPFVIRNRVLGEREAGQADDPEGSQRIADDSALVNYAYRTPHYLLGSTLQNPALDYAGISRQNRACGLLFVDPSAKTVSEVHPVVEHIGGGRSQHSFWSVQHENVLLLQRIGRAKDIGSYNTGKLGMRFEGTDLEKVEEGGWIFASNGKAFAGVKFLDGGYQWDEKRQEVYPANFAGAGDTTRILLDAGDVASDGSFAQFRERVQASSLTVTADKVAYGARRTQLAVTRYDAAHPELFTLPRINGAPVELHPQTTFQSPFLNSSTGSDRITVTVGPITQVLDFSEFWK